MPRTKSAVPNYSDECRLALESAKEAVEKLDHRLFGNGQPGVVADLQAEIDTVREDLRKTEQLVEQRHTENVMNAKWHARLLKWAIAAIVVMPALSGTGVVSLEHAITVLKELLG